MSFASVTSILMSITSLHQNAVYIIHMFKHKSLPLLLLTTLLPLLTLTLPKYAMNKPHMLFQVSSRQPTSLNAGWGYWSDSCDRFDPQPYRMRYFNDKVGLHCHFTEHDGENHFKQVIRDSRHDIVSEVRYQSENGDTWEAQIEMEDRAVNQTAVNAFVYLSVENNDYFDVDKVGYYSQKRFVIDRKVKPPRVLVFTKQVLTDIIYIQTENDSPIEVMGFHANVSETWKISNFVKEFMGLIEMHRNNTIPKAASTADFKALEWQKGQLAKMKKDDWETDNYAVMIICARFKNHTKIHLRHVKVGSGYTPFNEERYMKRSTELLKLYEDKEKKQFMQHVLFNLLGGIAHYYGPLYAQNSLIEKQQTITHSTTPSRLIFPRCFLWDDGFHLTVLADKHPELSLKFLSQWIDKIDLFGWIAREQIRGFEVSAMMPDRTFVYQDSLEGNPPTLMLPIRYMLEHYPDHQGLRELLQKNMWKLEKWFRYFKTTQSHFDLTDAQQIDQNIKFRWRCKDSCQNGNFMGSGLDDYPRQDAHQLSKQHVDLISWLYFFADNLHLVSKHLGNKKGEKYYHQLKTFYNETLHKHYLDNSDHLFKDISVSDNHNINGFVTHLGYINLFPFMMGMVHEGGEIFKKIVEIMTDEDILWSQSGLRSLSKSDRLYGTLDNYWRGAVWMPINYMVLRACKLYYPNSTGDLYKRLKANLVKTVEGNRDSTGYLYENYHQGKGNRGYPFYGWTSLINPIILDLY